MADNKCPSLDSNGRGSTTLLREAQNLSPSDDLIAFAITETFGERCKDRDADCYTCQAWDQYDKARAALQSQPTGETAVSGDAAKLAEALREIPADLCWTEDRGNHRNLEIGKLAHQAAAALRASPILPDREAWQPIETAPRDGTPVDLWIEGPDNNVDFYSQTARKVKGRPVRAGRSPDWVWHHVPPNKPNWYPLGGMPGFPLMPGLTATHWMPLSAPPTPGAQR